MLSWDQYRTLLEGAWVTVQVTVYAVALGTVLAIVLGVASLYGSRPVRAVVRVYVEFFRGVSAIILLIWVFYALPLMGVELTPMQAGVLALGLNLSAYGTEVVRGAVQAVPQGQTEAAIAVHLSPFQRLRHVVLPQAFTVMLPPYGNLVIEAMKASALVSLITVSDLLYRAQTMRNNNVAESTAIFVPVLLMYFAISLVITAVVRLLERRFGRGLDTGPRAGQAVR